MENVFEYVACFKKHIGGYILYDMSYNIYADRSSQKCVSKEAIVKSVVSEKENV